jgi:hypothetical protein
MPDYDIDLTLDSLMIPAISTTFPFGTKVIPTVENKGGLSTFEVNSNVMLPFTRMRPRVCSADSVTSRVEYDAKIVFSAPSGTTPSSGYTLTLGTGDYVGCTVTFTNLLAHACTVRQSDGTTTLFSVPAGKTMSAMWGGSSWLWTTAGSVTAGDPTPVSSAAVQAAVGEWPKFGLYAGAACSLRDVSANTTGQAVNPYLIRLTDKMAIASVILESASGPVAATNNYSINVANMNVERSISLLVSQNTNPNASLFFSSDISDFWVGNLAIDSSKKIFVTATFIARLP